MQYYNLLILKDQVTSMLPRVDNNLIFTEYHLNVSANIKKLKIISVFINLSVKTVWRIKKVFD